MKVRPYLVALLACAALACSQSARVGNPVDGSVSPDAAGAPGTLGEFLQSFADSYCARIETCCGGLPADFPSRNWCVSSVTAGLGDAANAELPPEYVANSIACLTAVQAMGCMQANDSRTLFDLFLTPQAETACDNAPLPRASLVCQNGSACDGECVDNICYHPASLGGSCCTGAGSCSNWLCDRTVAYCDVEGDGLCHARLPVGDLCTDDRQCLSYHCDIASGRCATATLESVICS